MKNPINLTKAIVSYTSPVFWLYPISNINYSIYIIYQHKSKKKQD